MLKCVSCDEEIFHCDACYNPFSTKDTIICDGEHHFCSIECFEEYHLPDFVETTSFEGKMCKPGLRE